jgi:hypothetical protein
LWLRYLFFGSMSSLSLITKNCRFPLAVLFAVMAMFVLVDSASGSTSMILPSSRELPPGSVAAILQPPANLEAITTHEFERARAQAAAEAHLKRIPRPNQNGYWKLKVAAMNNLLDKSWIQGQAAEMGISFTPQQIATELAEIRHENFKSKADYRKFLKASHLTQKDARDLIKLQMLSTAMHAQVIRGIKGKKARRKALTRFVTEYSKRWRSRTVCAPGFVFGRCSNAHGKRHEGALKWPLPAGRSEFAAPLGVSI